MGLKYEISKFIGGFRTNLPKDKSISRVLSRRKRLLYSYGIDTVLDIGANSGQFAVQMRRRLGYTNRILSFEPLSSAFELLKKRTENDSGWQAYNFALGETEEQRSINIAGNSCSSSLLNMLSSHIESAPKSEYTGVEIIEMKSLDSVFDGLCDKTNKIYMKIDTQGYESMVLKGAEKSLENINTIQLEMSLIPLYEGELLFNDMCQLMNEKGYRLVGIEPGFTDKKSGELLQVDGIFHRF
ncbi:FkbM family methyltransferase [Amphritea balenae]|uniref:FkbM family methyltransferase n=1 Tax=Amphritea balenae TaxID=452629 RepID=A0A3P1SSX2_9GAMM|nr:FkbM family methyltransferase [Amphritea balenae]RRC99984.1 FkbM family methyltransferase [Amphritea balenae]GGK75622.1 hypothetical protein GCM10007941_27200 [Amphritea balenae]